MTDDAGMMNGQVAELDSMMLIIKSFLEHLEYTLGKDKYSASDFDIFNALAYAVRDRLIERWLDTQQAYYNSDNKRVYYISMEFLPGRSLSNSLINLGLLDDFREAVSSLGYNLDDICAEEPDAGLGNGGLGRLAACFLDSMATMAIPAYGYGIRYEYGIFRQRIVDGAQMEIPDNWLRYRNPWELDRQEHLHPVKFYGRVVEVKIAGKARHEWVDTEDVMAMAHDIPVPGYGTATVNTMRLWSAKSTRDFNLKYFYEGNYIRAVEKKMISENISKVLYPSDNIVEGRELRFKQEYFLASATVHDVLYRFKKTHTDLSILPEKVAIQLNDTHPALAIPELMRVLMDLEGLDWDDAWPIVTRIFAYTNHTILPEALEQWPIWFFEQILPRHLQIIYAINERFLVEVKKRFPGDPGRLERMSLVEEHWERKIRMAHLAVVGSHSVNGVAALHTEILKTRIFPDFHEMYPERFNNKTNGITQRRWLKKANPQLAALINQVIGEKWTTDLFELEKLAPLVNNREFLADWRRVKRDNKQILAAYILKHNGIEVDPESMFDCHIKRIHEYKRQLLNLLHIVTLFNRIKANPASPTVPRTFIFSGKAAPSYVIAKLIIKLINSVAATINSDPAVGTRLKVVFLANYGVTLAEQIIPAADLSEQISTAGTEASGTGNMKFALNGALTIGTLDGANIEIMEEVGRDNIFIFGLTAAEVNALKEKGYNPRDYYARQQELKLAIDMIAGGTFSPEAPDIFKPIVDTLLNQGDSYLVLTDFAAYVACQEEVGRLYLDQDEWARRTILNTAAMGKFSSDRAIAEYASEIWDVQTEEVTANVQHCLHEGVCLVHK
jgi:starch phosphorylase